MGVLDLLNPEEEEDVGAEEGIPRIPGVTVGLKLLQLPVFLEDLLQWTLNVALQALPDLLASQIVVLLLHAVRYRPPDHIKRQLVRQLVVDGELLEDFDAEVAFAEGCSHLEVGDVDEVEHQAEYLIVDLGTDTQLAV